MVMSMGFATNVYDVALRGEKRSSKFALQAGVVTEQILTTRIQHDRELVSELLVGGTMSWLQRFLCFILSCA